MSLSKFYPSLELEDDSAPLYEPCVAVEQTCSQTEATQPTGLTGARLRSYAFALLTRREYAKTELTAKLNQYAANPQEVQQLVEELARENYQSDQRVAELVLSSHQRRGKGPQRIKLALKHKNLDSNLVQEELKAIDWEQQAYALKVKKFGSQVEKDPKQQAKQIRFLLYRGFDMDVVMKAIRRKEED